MSFDFDKVHEECGLFGVYSPTESDVASTTYYGLFALQHRGQESCGICVGDDGLFRTYKDVGIVNDVFTPAVMESLGTGNMAIGHVLYGTEYGSDRANAQPIVANHIKGRIAVGHNGSLVNYVELREELEMEGALFHTRSQAEVIASILIKERLTAPSIEQALNQACLLYTSPSPRD